MIRSGRLPSSHRSASSPSYRQMTSYLLERKFSRSKHMLGSSSIIRILFFMLHFYFHSADKITVFVFSGRILFSNRKIQVYLCTVSKLNRYISFLLLVCLLPVVTPREFIHDLFGHEDTQDHYHSAVTIEKIHKHCSIFQISFSIFLSSLKSFFPTKEIENCAYSSPQQTYIPGISVNLSYLRAPPTYYL